MAFIVVHEILAASRVACIRWAIWNVLANTGAIILDLLFEPVIAIAVVIIIVLASRLLVVFAGAMCAAHVRLAIIHVQASSMVGD
jgi:hypothetical protein